VYAGIVMLSLAASVEQEMLTIGKYDGYITFSNNNGQSIEDAIIIDYAQGEEDGEASEYYFLQEKFGQIDVDWFLESQELVTEEKRFYDKMNIELADKTRATVYFDITEFFGVI
jgi:hypothetical protein